VQNLNVLTAYYIIANRTNPHMIAIAVIANYRPYIT